MLDRPRDIFKLGWFVERLLFGLNVLNDYNFTDCCSHSETVLLITLSYEGTFFHPSELNIESDFCKNRLYIMFV